MRDAIAVPPGFSDALSPCVPLAHAVDAADAGVDAGGPLPGGHARLGARAVRIVRVAGARHAADGVAGARAEAKAPVALS